MKSQAENYIAEFRAAGGGISIADGSVAESWPTPESRAVRRRFIPAMEADDWVSRLADALEAEVA